MTSFDVPASVVPVTLRRALGRWDMTAIGINQVIGGAVFLVPSQVAQLVGGWSVAAVIVAGLSSLLVALCFAEAGSRFDATGGAYLYTRVAFGRFIGFEVGWMQWFTRVTSQASVSNGIALALAFYWPDAAHGFWRVALITVLTVALMVVNVAGIKQSAWLVNALTIAKLVPLIGFVACGIWFRDRALTPPFERLAPHDVATAALLLIFTFGGYDVVAVPAGEALTPRRHVPFAVVATVIVVTVILTLVQFVLTGILPDLAHSPTPVADAALRSFGPAAALAVGIGAVLSMTGNNAGQVLSGSRMLFALAERGDLPHFLGRVHPRYHTPANAVVVSALIALVLALSGTFMTLAAVSAVARLVAYAGTAGATLQLRRLERAGRVPRASFVLRFGALVPLLALLTSLLILLGGTAEQLGAGAVALLAGGALFGAAHRLPTRAPH